MADLRQFLLILAVHVASAVWRTKCYGGANSISTGGAYMQPPAAIAHMRFTEVDANGRQACGLNENRTVVCWGGEDDETAVQYIELPGEVSLFTQGHYSTCIALVGGGVQCYENYVDMHLEEPQSAFNGVNVTSISISDQNDDRESFLCILDGEGLPMCVYYDDRNGAGDPYESPPSGVKGTKIVATKGMACVLDGTPSAARCWGHDMDLVPGVDGTVLYDMDRWGKEQVCGINATKHMLCWGRASYDTQQVIGDIDNSQAPFVKVVVGGESACGLTEAGTLLCFGESRSHAVPAVKNVSFVGAGGSAVCASGELDEPALDTVGWHCAGAAGGWSTELAAWGNRNLDMPAAVAEMQLENVGRSGKVACGMNAEQNVVCWGRNAQGVSTHYVLPQARAMHVGPKQVCLALLGEHGGVQCYLTGGSMTPEAGFGPFLNGTQVTSIFSNNKDFLCAIDVGGVPHCYEENDPIDLKTEVTPALANDTHITTAVKVVTVEHAICLLTAMPGSLKCSRTSKLWSSSWKLDDIFDIEDVVYDVAAGRNLLCALVTENRTIKCWGRTSWGSRIPFEEVLGGIDNSGAPYAHIATTNNMVCGLSQDNRVVCSGLTVDINNLPPIALPVVSLSAGGRGICVDLRYPTSTSTTTSTRTLTSTSSSTSTLSTSSSSLTSSTSSSGTSSSSSSSTSSSSTSSSSSSKTKTTSSTTSRTQTSTSTSSATTSSSTTASSTSTSTDSTSSTMTTSTSTSKTRTSTSSSKTSSTSTSWSSSSSTSVSSSSTTSPATTQTATSTTTFIGGDVSVSLQLFGLYCQGLLSDGKVRGAAMLAIKEGILAGLGHGSLNLKHVQTELSCAASRRLQGSGSVVNVVSKIASAAAGLDPDKLISAAETQRVRDEVELRARQAPGIAGVQSGSAELSVHSDVRFTRIGATATTTTVTTVTTNTVTTKYCGYDICVDLAEEEVMEESKAGGLAAPSLCLAILALCSLLL